MSKVLDCESVNSTYQSLSSILGVERSLLRTFLRKADLGLYYEQHPHEDISPTQLILRMLQEEHSVATEYDSTCWFHFTRVSPDTSFAEGLLPLPSAIEYIWPHLRALAGSDVAEEQWLAFRRMVEEGKLGDFSSLYAMKMRERCHWGPWAILVRDVMFKKIDPTPRDYFVASEVVEDICNSYNEYIGGDLLARFMENTHPCVVKFVDSRLDVNYLGVALSYLNCIERGVVLSREVNESRPGDGQIVGPVRILRVEFLAL